MSPEILELKIEVYPLGDLEIAEGSLVRDHINLSGSSPKDLGFIPITDLYVNSESKVYSKLSKHGSRKDGSIIVACLKEGVTPSEEETKKLLEEGVSAYTYSLIKESLQAASQKKKVKAEAYVPKLPAGFKASGRAAGLKETKRKDLGVISSDYPCDWAGVFTQNKIRAICVDHNEALLGKPVRAILVNSGNANACTGKEGAENDKKMRASLAANLGVNEFEVLTASTGVIGVQLDFAKVERVISSMDFGLTYQDLNDFAQAILTTDLTSKLHQSENFLGFAKGSGMIHPNMATMLSFIITDANIEGDMQAALKEAVDATFNSISVDGDTSTNDMVLLLTNRQGKKLSELDFKKELKEVCENLAIKIVKDGEGATKLIEVKIEGALSKEDASLLAKSVIGSSLVKTAIFGCDPNWGRIIASLGYSGAEAIDENKISMSLLGQKLFEKGAPTKLSLDKTKRDDLAKQMKANNKILIEINMGLGKETAKAWGSDLSYDYVRINAEYFS